MKYKLITLGLAALAVPSAHAIYILESFETDVFASGPGKLTAQSNLGVTHGNFSMRVTDTDGAWTWVHREWNDPLVYQAWRNNRYIWMDVHIAPRTAHNVNIALAINSALGWRQNEVVAWPWISDNVGYTQTLVWDYSALLSGAPATSPWFQFHLMTRTGPTFTPIDFHVDNVRFVPEPMSMTALGLGAAALIWKRRKKK